jgi:hypothetical protein
MVRPLYVTTFGSGVGVDFGRAMSPKANTALATKAITAPVEIRIRFMLSSISNSHEKAQKAQNIDTLSHLGNSAF